MNRKSMYLTLCLVGTILPYWQLLPWVFEHGLNVPLFFNDIFANRISAFFTMDVLVSAIVLFVFIVFERRSLGSKLWLPAVAVLIVGVSLGLPLLLYLRENHAKTAGYQKH